ncbi:MAG: hypothetical protein K2P58_02185 [Hyphomonadaceae bacterium]|nr:hypothetical protein [Hyphomonadaceae bacterium]
MTSAATAMVVQASEFTDRHGAKELKARIEAYWRARGFEVQVMLLEGAFTPQLRACRVDVRSDLVNGLPRQHAKQTRTDDQAFYLPKTTTLGRV